MALGPCFWRGGPGPPVTIPSVAEAARLDVSVAAVSPTSSSCFDECSRTGIRVIAGRLDRSIAAAQEPLFLAALAFSAGIIAANYLWRSPHRLADSRFWLPLLGAALLLSPLAAARLSRLVLLAMIPLGGFYLQARMPRSRRSRKTSSPSPLARTEVDVTAHVIREGLIRDSPYGGKQESVDVESEQLQLGDDSAQRACRHSADHLQQADRGRRSSRRRQRTRRCASTPTASGCV